MTTRRRGRRKPVTAPESEAAIYLWRDPDDPHLRAIVVPKDGAFDRPGKPGYRMFINGVSVTEYPTPFKKGDIIHSEPSKEPKS